jgi:hypothetical protein
MAIFGRRSKKGEKIILILRPSEFSLAGSTIAADLAGPRSRRLLVIFPPFVAKKSFKNTISRYYFYSTQSVLFEF